MIICVGLSMIACEDFVEVDAPDYKIISDEVFNSEETAQSAMIGIYNQLFNASFSNGNRYSVTVLAALSGDELRNIRTTNLTNMEFQQHEISPINSSNLILWSGAYNMIYMTNAFLEGIAFAENITPEVKNRLAGEAKFIRAFTYFYLTNLYGDVPLVLGTDYQENELVKRASQEEVYSQILLDLQEAVELLTAVYGNGRLQVNKHAAMAMLARVYLYEENWQLAEEFSSQVIAHNASYDLLENLDDVFLANSREAIWQISPSGRGAAAIHTNEGNVFIINPVFSFFASVQLVDDFVGSFSEQDKRLVNWIGYNEGMDAYFPFKYKIWNSNEQPIREYSMVLRLAEQYLIRAEARARQNNLAGAIEDIDMIRSRAGLELLADIIPEIGKEELLDEIMEQRNKELFSEWGHRWLDLKRTGRYEEILGNDPLWEVTDLLYPIPAEERMKNPNLTQNPGY